MAKISSSQIEQLQQAFARPERISDGAMLAGNALALPMLAARRRQAGMEAVRTERRLGADHPEAKARRAHAESLATREQLVRKEVARQRLVKPVVGDQAGLYGRVTRRGEPVPGVAVAALDGDGQSLARSCTGHEGDYLLAFPPDTPIRVEVRDEARRLFRDEAGVSYPPHRAVHRDVELSKAKPVCPEDRPAQPGGQMLMPSLVGSLEEKAVSTISALGLEVGERRTRKGAEGGYVLDHNPRPGDSVAAGTSVDLTVSVAEETPASNVPDLTGQSLNRSLGALGKAGAQVGTVNVNTDGGRTPIVRTSRPDAIGGTIDLDISTSSGDAQMMMVVAAVLAASLEGAALGLVTAAAAAQWLKSRRMTNLETIGETLAMDDAALRRRMRLKPEDPVEPVRGLLKAALARVRKV